MVSRERAARRERGTEELRSSTLATTGASLGGGTDSRTAGNLAGSAGTVAAAATRVDAAARAMTCAERGVGIARSVIFSLRLSGGGKLGGAGGKLERAIGISSESGASPPRTTTACRGGAFNPGRAMKPPRGVSTSPDEIGLASGGSFSDESNWLIGLLVPPLPRLFGGGKKGGISAHKT
jgi:hypothetical protein